MIAESTFTVTSWDDKPYDNELSTAVLSQAAVSKIFEGDLIGSSLAQVLLCVSNPDDFTAGAGYIGSEVFQGTLHGKEGEFVFQHGGLSGPDGDSTFGTIVPGSGTKDLNSISGTAVISRDPDGTHHITIDYSLGKK